MLSFCAIPTSHTIKQTFANLPCLVRDSPPLLHSPLHRISTGVISCKLPNSSPTSITCPGDYDHHNDHHLSLKSCSPASHSHPANKNGSLLTRRECIQLLCSSAIFSSLLMRTTPSQGLAIRGSSHHDALSEKEWIRQILSTCPRVYLEAIANAKTLFYRGEPQVHNGEEGAESQMSTRRFHATLLQSPPDLLAVDNPQDSDYYSTTNSSSSSFSSSSSPSTAVADSRTTGTCKATGLDPAVLYMYALRKYLQTAEWGRERHELTGRGVGGGSGVHDTAVDVVTRGHVVTSAMERAQLWGPAASIYPIAPPPMSDLHFLYVSRQKVLEMDRDGARNAGSVSLFRDRIVLDESLDQPLIEGQEVILWVDQKLKSKIPWQYWAVDSKFDQLMLSAVQDWVNGTYEQLNSHG